MRMPTTSNMQAGPSALNAVHSVRPSNPVLNEGYVESALGDLELALGYRFSDRELLSRALTLRSFAIEEATRHGGEVAPAYNERFEFLGDAVLGLVVAQALFSAQPDWREGELTRARANLINRRHIADVASNLNLGKFLRLAQGEERSGLRKHSTVLSNHLESLIGAIFLDGGLEPVRTFVHCHVMGAAAEQVVREMRSGAVLGNFKSALQQHLQAAKIGMPVYKLKHESDGDPQKRFLVEVRVKPGPGQKGMHLAAGLGRNKKAAEQDAARRALTRLTRSQVAEDAPSAKETEPE